MKSLIVLSGGMDSATALARERRSNRDTLAITFWYGSKHNRREYESAKFLARWYDTSLERVELPFIAELFKSDLLQSGDEIPEGHYADPSMKRTVVPFRNGIMLAIAAGYAESIGADRVVLGSHAGDHAIYPDCRPDFTLAMRSAIALGTYAKIELEAPFMGMTKGDIVQLGTTLGVPYHETWSCYKGGELHCGKCGTCVERKEAFQQAGVTDPTGYEA